MQLHIVVECETSAGRLRRSRTMEILDREIVEIETNEFIATLRHGVLERVGLRSAVEVWSYVDGDLVHQARLFRPAAKTEQPGLFA